MWPFFIKTTFKDNFLIKRNVHFYKTFLCHTFIICSTVLEVKLDISSQYRILDVRFIGS